MGDWIEGGKLSNWLLYVTVPSGRPALAAIARLLLVFGLVAGGWSLAPAGRVFGQAQAATPALLNNDEEIVYIDVFGVIQVIDPAPPAGQPAVQWYSPIGGWEATALGDFNNDGDMEIVAITDEDGPRLTIYDPVVASGPVNPAQRINGLYWATLYETTLPAAPNLIGTGNFNPSVPGAEIVVVYDEPPALRGTNEIPDPRIRIMTQRSANPDGRTWETMTEFIASGWWTDLTTGDLEATGVDDLVLVDEEASDLAAFRISNGQLVRYYQRPSANKNWQDAQIGQVDPGSTAPELVLARQVDSPLDSLLVWRYAGNDQFADVDGRDRQPSPRALFLADVKGNGNNAIFMLRNAPATPTNITQLLSFYIGPNPPLRFDLRLDDTNSFRYGAGGDLDGDGKDEIAINSSPQIRVYNSPDVSTTDLTNYSVSSAAAPFQIGNLDRNGSVVAPLLTASSTSIQFAVPAGAVSTPQAIQVTNSTTAAPITFSVYTLPAVPYLTWTSTGSSTPATLQVTIDATEMLPDSVNGANLILNTTQFGVDGAPMIIPVLAKATAGLVVRPRGAVVFVQPCQRPDLPATRGGAAARGHLRLHLQRKSRSSRQRSRWRRGNALTDPGLSALHLDVDCSLGHRGFLAHQHHTGLDHADHRPEPRGKPGPGGGGRERDSAWRGERVSHRHGDVDLHGLWAISAVGGAVIGTKHAACN